MTSVVLVSSSTVSAARSAQKIAPCKMIRAPLAGVQMTESVTLPLAVAVFVFASYCCDGRRSAAQTVPPRRTPPSSATIARRALDIPRLPLFGVPPPEDYEHDPRDPRLAHRLLHQRQHADPDEA